MNGSKLEDEDFRKIISSFLVISSLSGKKPSVFPQFFISNLVKPRQKLWRVTLRFHLTTKLTTNTLLSSQHFLVSKWFYAVYVLGECENGKMGVRDRFCFGNIIFWFVIIKKVIFTQKQQFNSDAHPIAIQQSHVE